MQTVQESSAKSGRRIEPTLPVTKSRKELCQMIRLLREKGALPVSEFPGAERTRNNRAHLLIELGIAKVLDNGLVAWIDYSDFDQRLRDIIGTFTSGLNPDGSSCLVDPSTGSSDPELLLRRAAARLGVSPDNSRYAELRNAFYRMIGQLDQVVASILQQKEETEHQKELVIALSNTLQQTLENQLAGRPAWVAAGSGPCDPSTSHA